MSLRIIINDAIINTSTAHRVPPFSQGILFPDRLLRAHRAVEFSFIRLGIFITLGYCVAWVALLM